MLCLEARFAELTRADPFSLLGVSDRLIASVQVLARFTRDSVQTENLISRDRDQWFVRRTMAGSVRAARDAGSHAAKPPTSARTSAAAENVKRS
jgi:hypothetical protein